MVVSLTSTLGKTRIKEFVVTESKTVAQLLQELELSEDHVVLVNGERRTLDSVLQENESVIVLPLIAGG
jgi:sulfur carrier protein ThiS